MDIKRIINMNNFMPTNLMIYIKWTNSLKGNISKLTQEVMHSMIKITLLDITMKVVKRINPTSSHHSENTFSVSLMLYLFEMMDVD